MEVTCKKTLNYNVKILLYIIFAIFFMVANSGHHNLNYIISMLKFKKMAVIALLSAAFTSCSNESVETVGNVEEQQVLVPVTVHVSDFSVSQEELGTRATQDAAAYDGIKELTLAFYTGDGTQQYKVKQVKNSPGVGETFGVFSLSLPMGSYTMVVLANGLGDAGDDVLTLTSPTQAGYTTELTRETFATTQVVNVNSNTAVDISATLNRIVARFVVYSSDGRTANAAKVRMSLNAGSKAFNPTTGLATSNTGYTMTLPITKSVGQTTAYGGYIFLTSDEQDIDVTIETLDADDNVLFSKTVDDVPFKRNRLTKLTGAMYTNNSIAGAFSVNTDWLAEAETDF